jgi:hypothetical protein
MIKFTVIDRILVAGICNSVKQTHFQEANACSAGQEITRLLWKQNVHCHVHKKSLLDPGGQI